MTVQARLAAAFRCRRILFCLLVGVAALASWAPRGGGPIDLRWDGGAYYFLGTSLADGYRMRSEPGGLSSSLHPPLVPAFVALHELALQTADPVVVGSALKMSLALCSAAYAIAVFLLRSASLPLALSAGVTLVALLEPQYVFLSAALFTVLVLVVRNGAATPSGSPSAAPARSSPTRRGPRASPCSQPGWSITRFARKAGARSWRSPPRPSW